jgi:hypothetical protein
MRGASSPSVRPECPPHLRLYGPDPARLERQCSARRQMRMVTLQRRRRISRARNRQVSALVEAVDADGPSDFADAFARVDQDRCLLREFES